VTDLMDDLASLYEQLDPVSSAWFDVTVQIWGERTGRMVPCGLSIGVRTVAKLEKNGHKALDYSIGGVTVNSYGLTVKG
jgi:hypothetical protein